MDVGRRDSSRDDLGGNDSSHLCILCGGCMDVWNALSDKCPVCDYNKGISDFPTDWAYTDWAYMAGHAIQRRGTKTTIFRMGLQITTIKIIDRRITDCEFIELYNRYKRLGSML